MKSGAQDRDPTDLPAPVGEEEELLARVRAALARARRVRPTDDYDAELLRLRDSLEDERLPEDRASLLEQMDRVANLKRQRALSRRELADPGSPYFGHLRVEDDHGRRDVFVGKQTWIADDVRIVDWRHAPISRLFYQCREGDDYEIEIAGREVAGEVLARRTVTIQRGELLRVATAKQTWIRGPDGWTSLDDARPALQGGGGKAARPDRTQRVLGFAPNGRRPIRVDKHLPEIASLLDPEQFALITRPDSGMVAIQGSAGSGKTTVALHRVAYLSFQAPERFSPARCLVVVQSPALVSYISEVLPALGVEGVRVETYDRWARRMRQRHFPRLSNSYAVYTPATVSRLKRHSALLEALAVEARRSRGADPVELFDELFSSRSWLVESFSRYAPGAFSDSALDEVHDWCRRLILNRMGTDGPSLADIEEEEEEEPTLDVEDDALLLYLHQLLRGPLRFRRGKALRYRHLVVDEVQDLGALELRVLLGTVERGHPVTLAGDVAQRITDASDFGDWRQVLTALGHEGVELAPLKVSYRSTAPIMELAHHVLGPLAPEEPPATPRAGAPVELFRFSEVGPAYAFLADALHEVVRTEPHASVALLAVDAERADAAFAALERADLPALRRVADHDFSFAPGIEITDIRQAKGLEFDYVVLLDVDAETYPVTAAARRLLHVGLTRAAHQCWLISVGTPSLLLPDWLAAQRV